MSILEAQAVTKRFGKTMVVDDVSFSLQAGECFAILGPPGSGKTTLLRLLSGLEELDSGRVLIDGKDVTHVPATKRQVGMLFQHGYGLIPHMSVSENMALPLQHASLSKDTIKHRISSVARHLHISHVLEKKVNTLASGERLRAALARVLVKNHAVYFLDDIFAQLDTPTHLATRSALIEIQQLTHIACIYVTSDPSDAFALARRVAVMHEGKIEQIGTRAELLNSPATLWVAQWLGFLPMNTITGYLQGTYQPGGICYRVWASGFTPLLPGRWTPVIERLQSKDVILGIRPESILPEWEFREKWKPSFYTFKGEVVAREWHQGKTLAHIQLPQIEEPFTAIFAIAHDQLQFGQILTLAVDPEDFRLFHPRTQELLHAPMPDSGWNIETGPLQQHPEHYFPPKRPSG
jgi:ABC-type sugar transport system ATPase subunit